jgi:hypothetical protein
MEARGAEDRDQSVTGLLRHLLRYSTLSAV